MNLPFIPTGDYLSLGAAPSAVIQWLLERGVHLSSLQQFEPQGIDGLSFALLAESDVKALGVKHIGQRKRIVYLANRCRNQLLRCNDSLESFQQNPRTGHETTCACGYPSSGFGDDPSKYQPRSQPAALIDCDDVTSQPVEANPKPWKTLVAAFFLFAVCGLTSFVMVIAHERLPDMSKYPPLPDILLDNLPHIHWAFAASEWVGVILFSIWLVILFFHQYRCILLRRFFALTGAVFFLRSVTMIMTSLSVPGHHLMEQCQPYVVANASERWRRVFDIWLGLGMSIKGIQTCGDYMFSGHTTCLTLLNFFITEYSPKRFAMLHTFSWVLNVFGVFFILASHEHYSIDVFVAIYVSSRLFLYYHCLANNNALQQQDKTRAMIWFPMFTFFECDVYGIVPNTYSFPFGSYVTQFRRFLSYIHFYISTSFSANYKSLPSRILTNNPIEMEKYVELGDRKDKKD